MAAALVPVLALVAFGVVQAVSSEGTSAASDDILNPHPAAANGAVRIEWRGRDPAQDEGECRPRPAIYPPDHSRDRRSLLYSLTVQV